MGAVAQASVIECDFSHSSQPYLGDFDERSSPSKVKLIDKKCLSQYDPEWLMWG